MQSLSAGVEMGRVLAAVDASPCSRARLETWLLLVGDHRLPGVESRLTRMKVVETPWLESCGDIQVGGQSAY